MSGHLTPEALAAHARDHTPILVKPRSKRAMYPGWPQRTFDTEGQIRGHFDGAVDPETGLALRLGGGLADVDLDCAEALQAAPYLLPDTAMMTGRPSRPRSHWWFRYPAGDTGCFDVHKGPDRKSVVVELRADTGHLTVVPPSIHPSGEAYQWEGDPWAEPAGIDLADLRVAVASVAVVAVLTMAGPAKEVWTTKGSRDHAHLALAGGLLRGCHTNPEMVSAAKRISRNVAMLSGDEEWQVRAEETVPSTVKALSDPDRNVTGWTTLAELTGNRDVVAAAARAVAVIRDALGVGVDSEAFDVDDDSGEESILPNEPGRCRDHQRFERGCPSCEDWLGWQDLKRKDRHAELWEDLQDEIRRRAVADGTAVEQARAVLPMHTATEVAARPVLPDSLPGVLGPPGTVAEVTGYRGSGKSLAVLGISMAVTHDDPTIWNLPLRLRGPVLYVAREGVAGWTKRIKAWAAYDGRPAGDRLHITHAKLDITKPQDLAALATLVRHVGAVMVVLDPVSMTGGGREDEENYQEYRSACLDLAGGTETVVVALTNTGHQVRNRGRNSSMLVDGMDVSVALLHDERTGLVELKPNKHRDMGKVAKLVLRFEGAGDKDEDGEYLSGVMVRVSAEEEERAKEEADRESLKESQNIANKALSGRCECPVGVLGSDQYPNGCPKGGATNDDLAAVLDLGTAKEDRNRSKAIREALAPAVEHGFVRHIGGTRAMRWHWGKQPPPVKAIDS